MKTAFVILFIALLAISEAGETEVKVVEPVTSTTVKAVEKVDELIRPKRRIRCVIQNGVTTCTGTGN